jgi:putative mRNA 3-end processing factor
MTEPDALIVMTQRGLYCPAGDFYIDPAKPVQTAVITHGHGDHLREGSGRYLMAGCGLGIARRRLKDARNVTGLDYGVPVSFGAVTVSLHPAGHILGSAQVRVEHRGRVWVVSGDYKRQADPTCAPFEVLPCDVFISEATFAQPRYVWPDTRTIVSDILAWWRSNRERGLASVLFTYALGKAQRVLAELAAFGEDPVYVHGEIAPLVEVYRAAGVRMVPTLPAGPGAGSAPRGALVLAPPAVKRGSWLRRLGPYASGFCSGWMLLEGECRRRGYDAGFTISDHADWPALVETCMGSSARRVLLMHGRTEVLAAHLSERGLTAQSIESAATAGIRSAGTARI